eukprot:1375895-Amorphochlora_amoeboformis.AAC.1
MRRSLTICFVTRGLKLSGHGVESVKGLLYNADINRDGMTTLRFLISDYPSLHVVLTRLISAVSSRISFSKFTATRL